MDTGTKQERVERFSTDRQALAQARLLFVNLGNGAVQLLHRHSREELGVDFQEPPAGVRAHDWQAVVDCGHLATQEVASREMNSDRMKLIARRIAHHFA